MEKSLKIMLCISTFLFILFLCVLFNDYRQFQDNMTQIVLSLGSSDAAKLQASWFTIVIFRSVEILMPALIFGFGAVTMHFHDNHKPRSKR